VPVPGRRRLHDQVFIFVVLLSYAAEQSVGRHGAGAGVSADGLSRLLVLHLSDALFAEERRAGT
jgi:hypothetical protein